MYKCAITYKFLLNWFVKFDLQIRIYINACSFLLIFHERTDHARLLPSWPEVEDYRSTYDLGRFHPNFTDSSRACNFSYIFKLLKATLNLIILNWKFSFHKIIYIGKEDFSKYQILSHRCSETVYQFKKWYINWFQNIFIYFNLEFYI